MKAPSISDFLSQHIQSYFAIHDGKVPSSGLYNIVLNEVEKVVIAETLKHTDGVQARAAQILGISRNTLRKKMSDLEIA